MLLIRDVRVIDPASGLDETGNLLVGEDGLLRMNAGGADGGGCRVIDGSGLVVAPGLVDTHVHFRDPGFLHKEDLHSGALAAARGGVTSVVCMANTSPVIDSPAQLSDVLARGAGEPVRIYQAGAVSRGQRGEELADFAAMKEAGAVCVSDDGLPLANSALTLEAMRRAAALGLPISLHEEDPALIAAPGVNRGAVSERLGHPGAMAAAEEALVARDCVLALESGARVVIQHISSGRSVELVRLAKRMGADIHAEATPHHFTLTEEAVAEQGSLAKMNPPLRAAADRAAIIKGLRDGVIDIIATDHAPHAPSEKALPLAEAPSGIIGLETSLALGITELVGAGHLTLPALLRAMTVNPARCYGLDAGELRDGGPADLVLFDPAARWTVERFASRSSNSPFVGRELTGRVRYTVCRGRVVYDLGVDPLG